MKEREYVEFTKEKLHVKVSMDYVTDFNMHRLTLSTTMILCLGPVSFWMTI